MAKRKSSGFTIIEVALVLAVAALIFLVVFLAVPALQRNQRNDAVKRDIAFVVQAVSNYQSNKNALPDTAGLGTYLTDGLSANTPASGVTVTATAPTATLVKGTIQVVTGKKCGASPSDTLVDAGTRDYAVVGPIEVNGSTSSNYCQGN